MMHSTSLPAGWSLELDGQTYTVYSPGQRYSGSLSCALETGTVLTGESDMDIPARVMRALERHGRALECRPDAAVHVDFSF